MALGDQHPVSKKQERILSDFHCHFFSQLIFLGSSGTIRKYSDD